MGSSAAQGHHKRASAFGRWHNPHGDWIRRSVGSLVRQHPGDRCSRQAVHPWSRGGTAIDSGGLPHVSIRRRAASARPAADDRSFPPARPRRVRVSRRLADGHLSIVFGAGPASRSSPPRCPALAPARAYSFAQSPPLPSALPRAPSPWAAISRNSTSAWRPR